MAEKNNMINVFSSSNPTIINVAKTVLEEAGLDYVTKSNGHGKDEIKNGKSSITEFHVNEDIFSSAKVLLRDLEELNY